MQHKLVLGLAIAGLTLAACGPAAPPPPANLAARGPAAPAFAPLDSFAPAAPGSQVQNPGPEMQERVQALRAKAAALRGPVVPEALRARMQRQLALQ